MRDFIYAVSNTRAYEMFIMLLVIALWERW